MPHSLLFACLAVVSPAVYFFDKRRSPSAQPSRTIRAFKSSPLTWQMASKRRC